MTHVRSRWPHARPSIHFVFFPPFHFLPFLFNFMVDYSLVRSDCPLVSLFFPHLCSLFEAVGRKCPKVGLFVEKNCPYKSILLHLLPLFYRSVGIAQLLIMSREGKVRSSELGTGLSSSENCGAFKVTSPSTLIKLGVYAFMRLTSLVGSIFLSIPSLESFFSFCNLNQPS